MSDQPLEGHVVVGRMIASMAARTALETPGVLRLEPTLQGFLARLGPAVLHSLRGSDSEDGTYRNDGVTATIIDGIARVHLDLATDIAYTAIHVAETVKRRVREGIGHTGVIPGEVDVSILAIEPRRGPRSV